MVDEQQPPEDDATEHDATDDDRTEDAATAGPRRSTFTPPPQDAQYDPSATDDDALAGALAQDFRRWTPPPRQPAPNEEPTPQSSLPTPEPTAPTPEPTAPTAEGPTTAPSSTPSYVPPPRAVPAEPLPPASTAPPVPPASAAPPAPPVPPAPPAPPVETGPPAPPAPSAPASEAPRLPPPPRRESMTDAELLAAADLDTPGHDTSALLDLLEQQLQLREAEVQRLGDWEREVRDTVGPAAEPLVAEVRAQFTGSIPVVGNVSPRSSTPEVSAPGAPTPDSTTAAPAAAVPPPAPQSGPELDLALADAPPPLGAAVADVPPPSSAPEEQPPSSVDDEQPAPPVDDELPPPLVEPEPPTPRDPEVVTGSTNLEALFGAAQPGDDEATEGHEVSDDTVDVPISVPSVEPSHEAVGLSELPADSAQLPAPSPAPVPAAAPAIFDDLLKDPEPDDVEGDGDGDGVLTAPAAASAVTRPRASRVETVGPEPTPAEQRAGASVRLFWLWFAVNASVVSIGLGAVIFSLGMSLRQAVLATLIGVAVSFLPLALGTLAGKWSGQPTMIVSRATFGHAGNILPALVALVGRALWASALLWMLAAGVAEVLVGGEVVTTLGRLELALIAGGIALVLAAVIAGVGFGVIAIVSAVVSVLAGILVVGIIVLTVEYVDLSLALSVPDGAWALMVTGAVLVFSVVGLAWANSAGDVARYQGTGTAGAAAAVWTIFGATLPSFLLICWGAVLAASNPFIAQGLVENPVDLISRLLPLWYPVPLIAAIALSLLAAAALALYSGGFALQAVGARIGRPLAVLIVVMLTGALLAALLFVVPDLDVLFRDVVTTLAVPIAAWAGIFGAEMIIRAQRRQGLHSPSLVRSGGVYPALRWVNVVMLVVATGVGWGLTTAVVVGLEWQGYLWPLLGLASDDALVTSDLGVLVALGLGFLTPIVAGIPALRKLQLAERAAAEHAHSEPTYSEPAVLQPVEEPSA